VSAAFGNIELAAELGDIEAAAGGVERLHDPESSRNHRCEWLLCVFDIRHAERSF
jgi:hypothetical protein